MVGATGDVTETKQRERELQSARRAASHRAGQDPSRSESEERYALALELINENIYDWNIETGALYFSPGLRVMLGMTPEEPATLENWAALIHPDDRPLHGAPCLRISRAKSRASSASSATAPWTATGGGRACTALRCGAPTAAPIAWWEQPATLPPTDSASGSCSAPRPRPRPRIATSSTRAR